MSVPWPTSIRWWGPGWASGRASTRCRTSRRTGRRPSPGREAARAAAGGAFDLKSWHMAALSLGSPGLDDLAKELATLR